MNQRIVELEARITDLERTQERLAVALGRMLAMGSGAAERWEWLYGLSRKRDGTPGFSIATKRIIDSLIYGSSVAVPPEPDELTPPL